MHLESYCVANVQYVGLRVTTDDCKNIRRYSQTSTHLGLIVVQLEKLIIGFALKIFVMVGFVNLCFFKIKNIDLQLVLETVVCVA